MTDVTKSPRFLGVDHLSWTVPALDPAIQFYCDVIGAVELFRLGPIDAREMPVDAEGRDWTEAHLGVAGARLTLAMLQLPGGVKFQLVAYEAPADRSDRPPRNCDRGGHHLGLRVDDVDAAVAYLVGHGCRARETIAIAEGPLAGKKNVYVLDPFGHQLEIVD